MSKSTFSTTIRVSARIEDGKVKFEADHLNSITPPDFCNALLTLAISRLAFLASCTFPYVDEILPNYSKGYQADIKIAFIQQENGVKTNLISNTPIGNFLSIMLEAFQAKDPKIMKVLELDELRRKQLVQ